MKINQANNSPNFGSIYNNKAILKSLEKISEHGSSFITGTSCIGALILRPAAISLTPKAKKENKKILTAESISSALTKLFVAQALILPIENAIKNMEKKPENFLKTETIENLSKKDFNFLAQTCKIGASLISSIPKFSKMSILIPTGLRPLSTACTPTASFPALPKPHSPPTTR